MTRMGLCRRKGLFPNESQAVLLEARGLLPSDMPAVCLKLRPQNTHCLTGQNKCKIVVHNRALVIQPCCPIVLLHSQLRAVAAAVAVGRGTFWGIRK